MDLLATARLKALFTKLQPLVPYSSQSECDEAFQVVAGFATAALAKKRRRDELCPVDSAMLYSLVSAATAFPTEQAHFTQDKICMSIDRFKTVVARPGPHWLGNGGTVQQKVRRCPHCDAILTCTFACDGCDSAFCWGCAGYAREPLADPFFNGREVLLQAYCRACLVEKGLSADRVLAQESEFAALSVLFSSAKSKWRWIPGFSEGFCMFSAVWMSLEATAFESSPFFCGAGMEGDNMDWRSSAAFLSFVVGTAREAQLLAACVNELPVWQALEREPASCAHYRGQYRDASAFQAIAQFLSRTVKTRLVVWCQDATTLLLYAAAFEAPTNVSVAEKESGAEINILVWNSCCEYPHYDLLLPNAAHRVSVQFDLIIAPPKIE